MAPRAPESFEAFWARLETAIERAEIEVRFGRHHFSHAVCVEDGAYRVRRLEYTKEEAEAYLKEHGMFMPEHGEQIARPRTLVFECETLAKLAKTLEQKWPM